MVKQPWSERPPGPGVLFAKKAGGEEDARRAVQGSVFPDAQSSRAWQGWHCVQRAQWSDPRHPGLPALPLTWTNLAMNPSHAGSAPHPPAVQLPGLQASSALARGPTVTFPGLSRLPVSLLVRPAGSRELRGIAPGYFGEIFLKISAVGDSRGELWVTLVERVRAWELELVKVGGKDIAVKS